MKIWSELCVCVCVPILAYIVEWMYICRCPGCGQLTAIPSTLGGKSISTTTDSSSSPQGNPCGFTKKHFSPFNCNVYFCFYSLPACRLFLLWLFSWMICQLFPFSCQLSLSPFRCSQHHVSPFLSPVNLSLSPLM